MIACVCLSADNDVYCLGCAGEGEGHKRDGGSVGAEVEETFESTNSKSDV